MTRMLIGYMEHAQDQFSNYMENFAKKVVVQPDPIPKLFPFPPMEDSPSNDTLDHL